MSTVIHAPDRAGMVPRWRTPVRLTALHREHVARGAEMVERDGWLLPRSYGDPAIEAATVREAVGLLDVGDEGKIDLKSDDLDAALAVLRSNGTNGKRAGAAIPHLAVTALSETVGVCLLTRTQALLLTPPAALRETLAALTRAEASVEHTHATDLTGALCGLRLLGPRAPAVLERLSSLDLAPDRFADGALAQGGLARLQALIVRRDEGGLTGYDLYVDRDLGLYLWETLLEQGAPLGLAPVGVAVGDQLSAVS